MNDELKCPICGSEQTNKRSVALHMWNLHKVKYKEYLKGNTTMNENTKCADGLMKPAVVKESKEFINEQPKAIVDKDIIKESEKPDRDFVTQVHNPYRDLYKDDSPVMNEWLH